MGLKPRKPAFPPTVTIENREVDSETLIKELESTVDKLMDQQVEPGESFESYEDALMKLVHEIARRKLEKKLQTVADGFAPRLAIDHNPDWHGHREGTVAAYRRHSPGTATYHHLVGPLRVRRDTYRMCGSVSTYVPLDLATGLVERMTPALARCLAIGYAHMPLRTLEELMLASGLRPPSRSTLNRTARDLGDYAVACNEQIEPQVRASEQIPTGTRLIAIGLDRVAVPMRHGERWECITAHYAELRRSRPTPKPRCALRGRAVAHGLRRNVGIPRRGQAVTRKPKVSSSWRVGCLLVFLLASLSRDPHRAAGPR